MDFNRNMRKVLKHFKRNYREKLKNIYMKLEGTSMKEIT